MIRQRKKESWHFTWPSLRYFVSQIALWHISSSMEILTSVELTGFPCKRSFIINEPRQTLFQCQARSFPLSSPFVYLYTTLFILEIRFELLLCQYIGDDIHYLLKCRHYYIIIMGQQYYSDKATPKWIYSSSRRTGTFAKFRNIKSSRVFGFYASVHFERHQLNALSLCFRRF